MKFKSEILTQVSGSIGGVSYQRSRGGMVRFARPKPTNAASPQQLSVRARFTQVQHAWRDNLSEASKTIWDNYAAQTPIKGKLGDPLIISGRNMFLRFNTLRGLTGQNIKLNATPKAGLTDLGDIQVQVNQGLNSFLFSLTQAGAWRSVSGSRLLVFTSRFLNNARNSYSGRQRFAATIGGSTGSPPTSLVFTFNGFNQRPGLMQVGQKIVVRMVAFLATGEMSDEDTRTITVEA